MVTFLVLLLKILCLALHLVLAEQMGEQCWEAGGLPGPSLHMQEMMVGEPAGKRTPSVLTVTEKLDGEL